MEESDDDIVLVKDVNPVGYIAGGDLDYRKRPRPRLAKKNSKSLWVAYLLWLFGGWWALHLLYLRRDRQAFIWLTTFGGFFGVGVVRDFFRIPSYVKDINEDSQYIADLISKMKTNRKPPFSLMRFVGQILVGNLWSVLLVAAVPSEEVFGIKWTPLTYLSPVGAALAVWYIGNIGHSQGELKWAMIGALVVVPFSVFHPPFSNWSSSLSAVLFDWKGKQWQRTPSPKISLCKRLMNLSACLLIFSSLWISALYFNATVTDEHGERIKLRDAAKNFLNSPMFLQFKENLKIVISDAMKNGWGIAWTNFVELLDPHGKNHALKVLGLQKNASQEEIKATYKKLAKEWHPDRHEDKEAAHEKFMEIREAYEKLSVYENRRSQRNKH